MSRILLTGASGLLGINFGTQLCDQHEIVGLVNQNTLTGVPFEIRQVDLTKPQAVEQVIDQVKPDVIVHCAAMANVDLCETEPEQAYLINADVPSQFAKLTKERSIQFLHISTDAVFDGQEGNYTEKDQPNPLGVYAKTKRRAEQYVLAENPQAIIARVNFYGWSLSGKRSLSEFFFNNLAAKKRMMGFTDVYVCPLIVNDLVDILMAMIQNNLSGIYHAVSAECLNKYQFGVAIAEQFGLDARLIDPVSVADSGLKAVRSPNLTLDTKKLSTALGHPLPDQAAGLQRLYALSQTGFREKIQSFGKG
jgi:dTDP-4-dehydrorhamnose reductase